MLSDDLQGLHNTLLAHRQSGLHIQAGGIASLCRILQTAASDARALERAAVRQPCLKEVRRPGSETDVVDFETVKARRELHDWIANQGVTLLPPDNGGPGDAA